MKKFLCAILAMTLLVVMAVPVCAAEIDPEVGSKTQDVTADYTAPTDTDAGKVYYFTISWVPGTNNLAYEGKQATYTWDGETMKYTETVDSFKGWTGSAGYTVTVTNQSNDTITAATAATNTYNLTLTAPDSTTKTVENAAKGIAFTDTSTKGTAQTASFTYTYTAVDTANAPTEASDATITVGTITVTVSKPTV